MTAQTSITAAELRVGDRLVWPGESKYNVAADFIESVLAVDRPQGLVEIVTRHNVTNHTRLFVADYRCRVLLPRPADEATP